MEKDPIKVARYLLHKCIFYGDLITNLKMQKLLYYVYVWNLVKTGNPCFRVKFQAWPNGPVHPSVYRALKEYKSSPIGEEFTGINNKSELKALGDELGKDFVALIDKVYEKYGTKSAFELVSLTHSEAPWKNAMAREGRKEISDEDIVSTYGRAKK